MDVEEVMNKEFTKWVDSLRANSREDLLEEIRRDLEKKKIPGDIISLMYLDLSSLTTVKLDLLTPQQIAALTRPHHRTVTDVSSEDDLSGSEEETIPHLPKSMEDESSSDSQSVESCPLPSTEASQEQDGVTASNKPLLPPSQVTDCQITPMEVEDESNNTTSQPANDKSFEENRISYLLDQSSMENDRNEDVGVYIEESIVSIVNPEVVRIGECQMTGQIVDLKNKYPSAKIIEFNSMTTNVTDDVHNNNEIADTCTRTNSEEKQLVKSGSGKLDLGDQTCLTEDHSSKAQEEVNFDSGIKTCLTVTNSDVTKKRLDLFLNCQKNTANKVSKNIDSETKILGKSDNGNVDSGSKICPPNSGDQPNEADQLQSLNTKTLSKYFQKANAENKISEKPDSGNFDIGNKTCSTLTNSSEKMNEIEQLHDVPEKQSNTSSRGSESKESTKFAGDKHYVANKPCSKVTNSSEKKSKIDQPLHSQEKPHKKNSKRTSTDSKDVTKGGGEHIDLGNRTSSKVANSDEKKSKVEQSQSTKDKTLNKDSKRTSSGTKEVTKGVSKKIDLDNKISSKAITSDEKKSKIELSLSSLDKLLNKYSKRTTTGSKEVKKSGGESINLGINTSSKVTNSDEKKNKNEQSHRSLDKTLNKICKRTSTETKEVTKSGSGNIDAGNKTSLKVTNSDEKKSKIDQSPSFQDKSQSKTSSKLSNTDEKKSKNEQSHSSQDKMSNKIYKSTSTETKEVTKSVSEKIDAGNKTSSKVINSDQKKIKIERSRSSQDKSPNKDSKRASTESKEITKSGGEGIGKKTCSSKPTEKQNKIEQLPHSKEKVDNKNSKRTSTDSKELTKSVGEYIELWSKTHSQVTISIGKKNQKEQSQHALENSSNKISRTNTGSKDITKSANGNFELGNKTTSKATTSLEKRNKMEQSQHCKEKASIKDSNRSSIDNKELLKSGVDNLDIGNKTCSTITNSTEKFNKTEQSTNSQEKAIVKSSTLVISNEKQIEETPASEKTLIGKSSLSLQVAQLQEKSGKRLIDSNVALQVNTSCFDSKNKSRNNCETSNVHKPTISVRKNLYKSSVSSEYFETQAGTEKYHNLGGPVGVGQTSQINKDSEVPNKKTISIDKQSTSNEYSSHSIRNIEPRVDETQGNADEEYFTMSGESALDEPMVDLNTLRENNAFVTAWPENRGQDSNNKQSDSAISRHNNQGSSTEHSQNNTTAIVREFREFFNQLRSLEEHLNAKKKATEKHPQAKRRRLSDYHSREPAQEITLQNLLESSEKRSQDITLQNLLLSSDHPTRTPPPPYPQSAAWTTEAVPAQQLRDARTVLPAASTDRKSVV